MKKEYFEKHYKVVGEYIRSATLYVVDRNGGLTDEDIIQNEDFENNYWAIVCLDDSGCYDDTVEDDFRSAKEAWDRYDEMEKEMCEGENE